MRNGGFGPVGPGWSAYPAGGRTDYPTCSSWRRTHIDWAVPDSRLQSSPPVRVPGECNRLGRRVPRDRLGTAREVEGVVVPAPLAYRRIRSPRECPALRQHRWMSSDTTPGCCAGAVVVVVLIHADLGGAGCACCAGTWCHAKEERDGDRHHGNGRRETIPTHRHDRRRDGDQPADSATLEHPSGPQISPGSRDAVTESNKPSALAIFERELRRLAARVGPPP
jgi:hypothetical protein